MKPLCLAMRLPGLCLLSCFLLATPGCGEHKAAPNPQTTAPVELSNVEIRDLREQTAAAQAQIDTLRQGQAQAQNAASNAQQAAEQNAAQNAAAAAQNAALAAQLSDLQRQQQVLAAATNANADAKHTPPVRHHAAAGPSRPASAASEATAASQPQPTTLDIWLSSLSDTSMEYQVPAQMFVGDQTTVTVVIHGPKDHTSVLDSGVATTHLVKYSPDMQVSLEAPGNTDVFEIHRQDDDPAEKPVPLVGYAQWDWTVKALKPKRNAVLHVIVSVIYQGDAAPKPAVRLNQPFPVRVNVSLPHTAWDKFWQWYGDVTAAEIWTALVSAFTAVSGWIAWWRQRLSAKAGAAAVHEAEPTVHA